MRIDCKYATLSAARGLKSVLFVLSLLIAAMSADIGPALAQVPDLGAGASLHGKQVFPGSNPWNQDISQMPVDPNSTNLLTSIGLTTGLHPDFGAPYMGAPNGIPYIVVPRTQATVPVTFDYADESDPGPYPIPANAPIEGGPNSTGDRHVLVIDRDNWLLYELYSATPAADFSSWSAGSGALFNLNSNALRPQGWTSADAAGLPIFPGLVRYDEVFEQHAINHALRFTVLHSRRGFVSPARHFASSLTGSNLPPMGMRVRLKASVDISKYPASVQVILTALKKYGMIVADNGSNWYISGTPDDRWNDSDLHTLSQIHGSDFEVVQMGLVTTDSVAIPTNLHANGGVGSISLTWSASTGAASYIVKRSTSAIGPFTNLLTNLTQTSATDTTLTPGMTYYYVVSAVVADTQSFDSGAAFAAATAAAANQINSGGASVGTFSADTDFAGGAAFSTSSSIDTSGVTNPAPAAVYQTLRADPNGFSYSLPNLTSNASYKVRLHFVEISATIPGQRVFNVSINGVQVLSSFDPFTAAGGRFKAVVREFNVTADANGKIGIVLSNPIGKGTCLSAVEVLSADSAAPPAPTGLAAVGGSAQVALNWNTATGATTYNLYRSTSSGAEGTTPYKTGLTTTSYADTAVTNGTTYFYKVTAVNSVGESGQSSEASATPSGGSTSVYQINSGGPAVGSFIADNYFSGGTAFSTSSAIDISGVTNPAPAAVYQTLRADPNGFSYSLPNLTTNASYKVRLHFVEISATVPGQRVFNVSINGAQVLSSFDPFSAAGGRFKAVVREFNVTADANGKIGIVVSNPNGKGTCLSAVEIVSGP